MRGDLHFIRRIRLFGIVVWRIVFVRFGLVKQTILMFASIRARAKALDAFKATCLDLKRELFLDFENAFFQRTNALGLSTDALRLRPYVFLLRTQM